MAKLGGVGLAVEGTALFLGLMQATEQYALNPTPETEATFDKALGKYIGALTLFSMLTIAGVPLAEIAVVVGLATLAVDMFPYLKSALEYIGSAALSVVKEDPLILDLDGDGIELIALSGSSAHFDYGQDGFAERTGWVAPDDGILVIDDYANASPPTPRAGTLAARSS